MIVPKTPQIWRMVQYIGRPLVMMAAYDTLVVVAYKALHWNWVAFRHVPLALYGSAICVILGFRNTSSYARWCEGRTLWSAIVNNSRSLARQVLTGLRAKPGEEAELTAMQRRCWARQNCRRLMRQCEECSGSGNERPRRLAGVFFGAKAFSWQSSCWRLSRAA